VIGDPIRHSLSPALHNAAFAALGLDWVFLAFPVPAGGVVDALRGATAMGLEGLSVTMPHKAEVFSALSCSSPVATKLRAVNTVVRNGDEFFGENTDGSGFLDALHADSGFDPASKRCVVLGAGGAARAVVLGLAGAQAERVTVINRNSGRGNQAAGLAGRIGGIGSARDMAEADLVVNATPVGMPGVPEGHLAIEPNFRPGQLFVDLVYHPPVTPLMDRARSQGADAVNGLGLLVHQAARACALWTGMDAPVAAMRQAAEAELAAG